MGSSESNAAGVRLAITTIKDLLIDERLSRGEDGNPVEGVHLAIPDYQRPYKWTVKNVIQLLDDIAAAKETNKEVYRVGTLILHHEANDKGGKYNIVDGQQRTISFSLLIRAFSEGEMKVPFLNQMISEDPYTRTNIPKNFMALCRRADSMAEERERTALLDYLLYRCELVVVTTEDEAEAFQFFDSQNARGKKLYPHDLLKAFHLREMRTLDEGTTERIVKKWEDLDQSELSDLFSAYLYRIKEWIRGDWAYALTEQNIYKFKGVTGKENYPYAQYYKGAYAYADAVNHSSIPFVAGMQDLSAFQIDSPIIAGKAFFEYTEHYFNVLKDIRNNDRYEGFYINDNEIVRTLDLPKYRQGVGNNITRLLFDTAALLYVDRFCPEHPNVRDTDLLDRFVVFDFIWAYSLRAQYQNLGWQSAQNYILSEDSGVRNSFNMYRAITQADSPLVLLSTLADEITPLKREDLSSREQKNMDELLSKEKKRTTPKGEEENPPIPDIYLFFFRKHKFLEV